MPGRYFNQFPTIRYAGHDCVNITERAAVLKNVMRNPYAFYPYDLLDGQRADMIADQYIGDSFYSWLIWMSNGVVDPYYDWHLSAADFDATVEHRYGSEANAANRVAYWRSNWRSDPSVITPSGYDALGPGLKKYWTPVYGANMKVQGYERAQVDLAVNTNQIWQVGFTGASPTVGDVVSFTVGPLTLGGGTVTSVAGSAATVQDVSGSAGPFVLYDFGAPPAAPFQAGESVQVSNSTAVIATLQLYQAANAFAVLLTSGQALGGAAGLRGLSSGAVAAVANSAGSVMAGSFGSNTSTPYSTASVVAVNIPIDEAVHWEPVSWLDYETETNELKKTVNIIDKGLATTALSDLKSLMNRSR